MIETTKRLCLLKSYVLFRGVCSIRIHVNAHIQQQQHISQIRETVNRCGEPERRRSLWKQIAEHMLRDIGDDDVEKVMKVRNDNRVR